MRRENEYYGVAKVSHFLPTVPALRYFNCCTMAGWHDCNSSYHRQYEKGLSAVLTILTVDGGGWIKAGERRWELSKGDIVVVPSGTPIEYATSSRGGNASWEFYWLDLDGSNVQETAKRLWEDGFMVHHCHNAEFFIQIFQWLLETAVPEPSREPMQASKIQDLFHKLTVELLFERRLSSTASDNISERILEYIQTNYARKITLEECSQHFFLSKNQIIRIFQKRTGYTPYDYIKRYRLMKACELLMGTMLPIHEIGDCVGYCNNSHFTAQFRECYGMTPTEYRDIFSPETTALRPFE